MDRSLKNVSTWQTWVFLILFFETVELVLDLFQLTRLNMSCDLFPAKPELTDAFNQSRYFVILPKIFRTDLLLPWFWSSLGLLIH